MTRKLLIAAVLLLTVAGCGGDDPEDVAGDVAADVAEDVAGEQAEAATSVEDVPAVVAPATTAAATTAPATSPATTAATTEPATTAPPEPAWQPFELEGCMCSDGSDVTFYERAADPTKVVLFFQGGGACFNAATCDPNGQPTYLVNQAAFDPQRLEQGTGYFDFDNPENPLADYSFVYVPYCTGDVHMGNATTDYGDGIVIEHHGQPNAAAALDYLVERYPDAAKLVVTGESAGSVPTPVYAALAADLLPDAEIVTFGDSSGAYPDVDAVTALIAQTWGTMDALPDWPETAGIGPADWSFPEQYIIAGQHAPRVRFGRFDHAFDGVQAAYGQLAGVPAAELVTLIDANEARIEEAGVPLAAYVAPGDAHTLATTDMLYETEVEGVRLIDWLTTLIDGAEPPPDVHCETCS
jgi:hypothetical protein